MTTWIAIDKYIVVKRKRDRYFRSRDVRLMLHNNCGHKEEAIHGGVPPLMICCAFLARRGINWNARGVYIPVARRNVPLAHRTLIIARCYHHKLPCRASLSIHLRVIQADFMYSLEAFRMPLTLIFSPLG